MFSFEAIGNNNGWAIAGLGISIVFCGLSLLAGAISQLHKLLDLWDNRKEVWQRQADRSKQQIDTAALSPLLSLSPGAQSVAKQYKILVDRLGQPFSLPRLIQLAERCGLHRPHAMINDLILAGAIVPDGKGYFTWRN